MHPNNKQQALDFLQRLEKLLNEKLACPGEMRARIQTIVAGARTDEKKKHLRLPEAAFLNADVIPLLFNVLQSDSGLSPEQSRQALLNEYYRLMPEFCCQSPIWWEHHPFKKVLGSPTEVYRGWTNPEKSRGLFQSCPDFALHDPFPHSIVFEGKYFVSGSLDFAQRQLVTDIYQAFFYRGLPHLAGEKKHPEWAYDYGCLLAYDASPKGTLREAWTAIPQQTRAGFWKGANVYVMVLRGSALVALA